MRRVGPRLRTLAYAALLGATACAAPNLSRTVGQGNGELHVAAGGPFFSRLGPTVPMPNVNVGGRVGATDWMDVDANVNALAAAFGIWAVDLAANFQLYRKPGGLAVATSTRVWTYGDLDDPPAFRAFPELGLHLGGQVPRVKWLHLYGGTTAAFSFRPPEGAPPVFVTPFFGTEFLLPQGKRAATARKPRQHGLALHVAWINPGPQVDSVVDYWPGYGAFSLQLGWRVRFGGLDR